jgi:hypothetical protein
MPPSDPVRELAMFFLEVRSATGGEKQFLLDDLKKRRAELAQRFGSEELERLLAKAIEELEGAQGAHIAKIAKTLAPQWVEAWERRQLAPLLLLFTDDASYTNLTLNFRARGKGELSCLLGRMLHDSDGTIALNSVESDDRKIVVTWTRTCTRISGPKGVICAPLRQCIIFVGTSTLLPRLDRVEACQEDWHGYGEAVGHLLLAQSNSPAKGGLKYQETI